MERIREDVDSINAGRCLGNNEEKTMVDPAIFSALTDGNDKLTSGSVSSALDDSDEEDEEDIEGFSSLDEQPDDQNDTLKMSTTLNQPKMNVGNEYRHTNDFGINNKVSLKSQSWYPKMSLLELAYKLKQAEYRVFGSTNGLQNRETLSKLTSKEIGESVAGELHESTNRHFLSSNQMSSSGNGNGIAQRKAFASCDFTSSSTVPIDSDFPTNCGSDVRVLLAEDSRVKLESYQSESYYPSVYKNAFMDAVDLTSKATLNRMDPFQTNANRAEPFTAMFNSNRAESLSRYSAVQYPEEGRRYPCSYCPYRSDTRSHLRRHEHAIHQNGAKARNRLPRLTGYSVNDSMLVEVSGSAVSEEGERRRHKCDQCSYETNSVCHLRRHQSTLHGKEKPFRCNICFLEFSRSEKVNEHFANFHPGVSFNIKAMRKVTSESKTVPVKKIRPVGTVNGGTGERGADGLEIVDTDLVELVDAAVAARGDGHKPFTCTQCPYSSRDVWHLRRHIADVHLKRRNYRCKVCRYATGRQDRLFTHMRSHGEMFCLYCDYSTAQVDTYRAHMQSCAAAGSREVSVWNESGDASSVQCSEQEQTCRLCNVVFSFRTDLEGHIGTVHVEKLMEKLSEDGREINVFRGYACRTCGHTDYEEDSIRDHVMTHALESFECTVTGCDFKATYARTLELHTKYYHNTPEVVVRPKKSGVASSLNSASMKFFSSLQGGQIPGGPSLSSSSSFTGIKSSGTPSSGQFLCPICTERAPFKYRRSFEKHITQHNVNVLICPLCVESFLSPEELHTHMQVVHVVGVGSGQLMR